MERTVLVTGGSGFLGAHVVDRLLAAGHRVRTLQRSETQALAPGVDARMGSVLESADVADAVAGCDAVFHLAGWVSRDPKDAPAMDALHVDGTRIVIDAAADAGVARIIYASTSGSIACSRNSRRVATELNPFPEEVVRKWPYYVSKIAAEKVAFERAAARQVELVSVHPSLLLGPGDARISSTEDIVRVMRRQVPALPSGGMNFVDVRDAAAATVAALEKGSPGERYLLGAVNWTVREFLIRTAAAADVSISRLPAPDMLTWLGAWMSEPLFRLFGATAPLDVISVEMSQVFWYFDNSKARSDLGFSPRDPDETLQDTVRDLRSRGVAP